MAAVRIEHTFECSENTFWDKIFFDEEYNRRLFKERLKFPVYEETKREERGEEVHRVIRVVPPIGDLPLALKKVLGDNIGYDERGVFNKSTRHYRIQIVPNKLADKLSVVGELRTQAAGPTAMKRIFEAEVTAKIFGVGGMMEKRIVSDLERSYEASAKFTKNFIEEKGLKG
jgi:hypothetical protein